MSEVPARCAPFEADLSALLDEQLDGRIASEVRAHLASCADCTRRLDALREVDVALQRLAAAPVDAAQRARMRPVLAPARPSHRAPQQRRRWIPPVALVATAAAAASLVLVLRPAPPIAPPAIEIAVAEQAAPKTRADAEIAARELAAKIDTPIGASAPPSTAAAQNKIRPAFDTSLDREVVEQLDLLETLDAQVFGARQAPDEEPGTMPSADRSAPRERIATGTPAERARLEANMRRWANLSPAERDRFRARWHRFQQLSPAERESILRERGAKP